MPKSQLTKDRIFEEAVEMFSSMGYNHCSMRALAERVGIRPSSLYNHYASKEELLHTIFDYFLQHDAPYRTPHEVIYQAAAEKPTAALLEMMFITYVHDEDFYRMLRILSIAMECRFENEQAMKVFRYVFHGMALEKRTEILLGLVERGYFLPFDCKSYAFLMASYSLNTYLECMQRHLSLPEFVDAYNHKMNALYPLIAPLMRRP